MNKFCIYKGVKVIKPETWDITSVELSNNYRSAIIQAESKVSTSQYTLDITPLINNQYGNGIDPYTATIVDELTGADNWIIDNVNKMIRYIPNTPDVDAVTSTLIQRYLKNPNEFVGMAAFHGLMEGIGWVMDEGGKVTKTDTSNGLPPTQVGTQYWYEPETGRTSDVIGLSDHSKCQVFCPNGNCNNNQPASVITDNDKIVGLYCSAKYPDKIILIRPTTYYTPSTTEATPEEIQIALQQALLNNNAMQAALIAQAIKDAYSYDVIGFNDLYNLANITYQQVTNEITSKAESGDTLARNSIVSIFNKITDDILNFDYSEFFEQNKQPKQEV